MTREAFIPAASRPTVAILGAVNSQRVAAAAREIMPRIESLANIAYSDFDDAAAPLESVEFDFAITLGGDGTETTTIGERAGPGFSAEEIVPAIERLVTGYLGLRTDADETFLQTYRRLGLEPFKAILYPSEEKADAA